MKKDKFEQIPGQIQKAKEIIARRQKNMNVGIKLFYEIMENLAKVLENMDAASYEYFTNSAFRIKYIIGKNNESLEDELVELAIEDGKLALKDLYTQIVSKWDEKHKKVIYVELDNFIKAVLDFIKNLAELEDYGKEVEKLQKIANCISSAVESEK